MLDVHLAATFAQIALKNVGTEYPYKLDQVLGGDDEVHPPRTLHPVFYGSYDWHSCVHMHWSLARLLRLHPDHANVGATREHFERRLIAAAISGELATLAGPHRASFERPYGWGWLLKLTAELNLLATEQRAAVKWRDTVAPLAQVMADRFVEFLPRQLPDPRRHPRKFGLRAAARNGLLRDGAAPRAAAVDRRARQSVVRP